jgi:hypothetical protein
MATVLVATSPAFLTTALQAMSDVPCMAFWTLALVAALNRRSVAAGFATALAVLIRPNLVPLAAVPAALVFLSSDKPLRQVARFTAAAAPAALVIAAFNEYLFDSPLRSGYGALENIYSMSRVMPNMRQYAGWFTDSQTPWPALGLLAPLVWRPHGRHPLTLVLLVVIFPLTMLAMYLPYLVFQPDEWWYLRFLLPGYPPVMIGFALIVLWIMQRVSWHWRELAAGTVIALLAVTGRNFAASHRSFAQRDSDARYASAVAYARRLPPNAVLFSNSHSGTLRLYAGRDVLRFEALGGYDIDRALAHVEARGHPVYLIGDPFEIDAFRDRFAGTEAVARLTRAPWRDLGGVHVYRLSATH